jgi:ATP-dependent DNA helicase RecG
MPITPETSVMQLSRIGAATATRLRRLGITNVRELLLCFPVRHEDLRQITPIADIQPGMQVTVQGRIEQIASRRSPRKRQFLTEAIIGDASGSISVLWFHQPYISKTLPAGSDVYLTGKADANGYIPRLISPLYEKVRPDHETTHTARIVPQYALTAGLTQKQLRWLIQQALPIVDQIPDTLSAERQKELGLIGLPEALRQIHFPTTPEALAAAVRRLKFDELLIFQTQVARARKQQTKKRAQAIPFAQEHTKSFIAALPFGLTDDQRLAAWEIIQDLEKPTPMHRLLQGEVGSGKTVVAALAALQVQLAGGQTAVLAPTEILAAQHTRTLQDFFAGTNVVVGLLTSSQVMLQGETVKKAELQRAIETGAVDIIVATHAILTGKTTFKNLCLVIADEQHRFGVAQRDALQHAVGSRGMMPHALSMTATPIPRSLALALYGDLAVSIIRHLPKERKPIFTELIDATDRERVYEFIRAEVRAGRQAFIVCPRIDPSDKFGAISVTHEYERLRTEVFPELSLGMLHGKLPSAKKEQVMADLLDKKIMVLVATSVVEVGVHVPNATVMVIEGAERFGLAQLHQFRGRVGRASHQAYCFLLPEQLNPAIRDRLQALVDSTDGFALAEKDLSFRGPGQLYGTVQSGWPEFKLASLGDLELISLAQRVAGEMIVE